MSADHDDFDGGEPLRGLPEKLPVGEHILWQGGPVAWELAKQVFHVRGIALYFVGLMLWRAGIRLTMAGGGHAALLSALSLLPMAILGLGLLGLLAWLIERTTVYTVTNRRVVLRVGIALPTAINIPFKTIVGAGVRLSPNGVGDIPFLLSDTDRVAYSSLWPHARPWRINRPQPMLRAIPDAAKVAEMLGAALREATPETASGLAVPPLATADPRSGKLAAAIPIAASLGLSS